MNICQSSAKLIFYKQSQSESQMLANNQKQNFTRYMFGLRTTTTALIKMLKPKFINGLMKSNDIYIGFDVKMTLLRWNEEPNINFIRVSNQLFTFILVQQSHDCNPELEG